MRPFFFFIKYLLKEPLEDIITFTSLLRKPKTHIYLSFLLFLLSFIYAVIWVQWMAVAWFMLSVIILRYVEGDWKHEYRMQYRGGKEG